ncbi:MAG: hypothetical protein K5761_00900 [Clostridiales bacterium]|nr:hypothetical protein [Clostridiales bacterium]
MKINRCPKCEKKISPFYLKENCPHCGVNILYYKLDERLESDAAESLRQEMKLKAFKKLIISSAFASPILIIRFILFFTPLASMCLPMYNGLTLISVIVGIIKGELSVSDNILPIAGMGLVIVLSLAVIISSLFSAGKKGLMRNLIFSVINSLAFLILGLIISGLGIGWYITAGIYSLEIILHFVCDKAIKKKANN